MVLKMMFKKKILPLKLTCLLLQDPSLLHKNARSVFHTIILQVFPPTRRARYVNEILLTLQSRKGFPHPLE